MKYFISLILSNLLFFQTAFATLTEADKPQIFNKNLLVNGGFEAGIAQWTSSGGSFAKATISPMVGRQHVTWNSSASSQTLTSTAVAIPAGMYGRNGGASCLVTTPSGTETILLQAYDGTNILSSVEITSSTTPTRTSVNFIFPASGNISLRLISVAADEPSIAIDDCYLGPAEGYNLSNISQAQFIGSAYFATTTNCGSWTRTNTGLGAFASDADCPGPTVEFNPGPGVIQTTDTDLPKITVNNLPPGNYQVVSTNYLGQSGAATAALAINDGTTTSGTVTQNQDASTAAQMTIVANFQYTTAGNRTFEIYGASASGTITLGNGASLRQNNFAIYRYPLSNEQAYTPDKLANSWSGYHDNTCSWSRTNTAYGDFTADASCALVERTNSNFGTVSASGSVLPAITFAPSRAGRYWVCATFTIGSLATNPQIGLRLWDGTTVIAENGFRPINATGVTDFAPTTLCGIYVASNTSAKTLTIQGLADTGAISLTRVNANIVPSIDWSIFQIDQSLPAPVLTGSSVTNSSGVLKTIYANLNCDAGSAITSQTGTTANGVSAIGNVSGGACAVTLAGAFSTTPYCFAVPNAAFAATGLILSAASSSSTAVSVDCEDDASTACTTFDFNLQCVGAP